MIRGRLGLVSVVAAIAIALLLGRALSAVMVDQAWYDALGASAVWREKLISIILLKGVAWLLGSAFAFANLWSVRRTILAIAVPARVGDLEFAEVIPARRLLPVTLAASALVGMLLTLSLDDWTLLSSALHGNAFLEYEPFFNRDLSFYVHWLPFEEAVYTWALISIVVVTALVTLLYAITRDLRLVERQLVASTHVRRHLTVLGSLVLMLLAWSYRLDAYELLLWGSGFDGMFNRVDHTYTSRIDVALAIGTLAAALVVLRAGWMGQVRAAFVTVTLVIIGALVLRQAAPGVVARGEWTGQANERDRDYVATRAIYSRRAYNVEGIHFKEPPAAADSAADSGVSARGMVLWDANTLLAARAGTESALAPVLPPVWQAGPSGAQAVVVTLSPALTPLWDVRVIPGTLTDSRGAPILARHRGLAAGQLSEPLVAPGFAEHRVVSGVGVIAQETEEERLRTRGASTDPFADRTVAAATMQRFGTRLAHAWATRDVSLLRVDPEAPTATVMHRDVRERVRRITPTLAQSDAISPIVYEGRLLWAIDLYSASEYYPLSIRFVLTGAPRSYFRLAATALIDAHTGRVRLVPAPNPDPIARTWFDRVPALIVEDAQLPHELRMQLPIPTDGALAQLRSFTRVGSRRTGHVPRTVPDSLPGTVPYPVSIRENGAIHWSVPLVDSENRALGVFEAAGGTGRESVWQALTEPLPDWAMLKGRVTIALDSTAESTRSDGDGPISVGAVRVAQQGGKLILMRPAYAADATGLRLIAVAASVDTSVVAGTSPFVLPGESSEQGIGSRDRLPAEREAESRRLYEAMREALRQSDWVRFGATFDSLGRVLNRAP